MFVKKDLSYVGDTANKLLEKGYAQLSVHSLWFDRYFTEEQKMKNRELGSSMSVEEWSAYCDNISKSLEQPMKEVLKKFVERYDIHQVSEETSTMTHYNSDWDLFFHSNRGWNGKTWMDSFDLTFNKGRTAEQNMKLLDEILLLLETLEYDNIYCRVQYTVVYDEERLAEEGIRICEELAGKVIYYCGYEGKIKEVAGSNGAKEFGFFKKRARGKYFPVKYSELVANYAEPKLLYDIFLDGACVGNQGDGEFYTEVEAQADADDYIISELSAEYNRPVSDFKVTVYKANY